MSEIDRTVKSDVDLAGNRSCFLCFFSLFFSPKNYIIILQPWERLGTREKSKSSNYPSSLGEENRLVEYIYICACACVCVHCIMSRFCRDFESP